MNATEINQTFDLVSYVGALVQLTKQGAYYIGACPMCGGHDRFNIKRGANDIWICRKCTDSKYHTPIDFVMAYHSIDFKEALKRMGGKVQQSAPIKAHSSPRTHVPVQVAPAQDWQAEAWRQVDTASDQLLEGEVGEAGRRYLTERGISRGAICMWLLGYDVVYGRPAIYIPYLDIGEVITAVKYRFIDERAKVDKGARFAMMAGSLPCLFGLQHIQ